MVPENGLPQSVAAKPGEIRNKGANVLKETAEGGERGWRHQVSIQQKGRNRVWERTVAILIKERKCLPV
jgi:hypothetical protein